MAERAEPQPGRSGPLGGLGGRAAEAALRPLSERAERLLGAALDSPAGQNAVKRALASDQASALMADFFDSGLFDQLVEHLLASPALWRLVDEIADSPAVTAAVTQQGLGFLDQLGTEVRTRSRSADDWLDRAADRAAFWRGNSAAAER